MNRIIKTTLIAALAAVVSFGASACGGSASASDVDASKQICVGTSPGPYSELFKKGVAPVLEKRAINSPTPVSVICRLPILL